MQIMIFKFRVVIHQFYFFQIQLIMQSIYLFEEISNSF